MVITVNTAEWHFLLCINFSVWVQNHSEYKSPWTILFVLYAHNEQFLRNGLKRPETINLIQICVSLLLINILNVQISILRLPAGLTDSFITWPYLCVWHEWHDLTLSHTLLMSFNLICSMHYYENSNTFVEKYFEKITNYYTFL